MTRSTRFPSPGLSDALILPDFFPLGISDARRSDWPLRCRVFRTSSTLAPLTPYLSTGLSDALLLPDLFSLGIFDARHSSWPPPMPCISDTILAPLTPFLRRFQRPDTLRVLSIQCQLLNLKKRYNTAELLPLCS
jgi:hypothetical protein